LVVRLLENLVSDDLAPSIRLALRASVRFWADEYMCPLGALLVALWAIGDRACKK
jgi:hypothetical protein